jgi:hypothetical protein
MPRTTAAFEPLRTSSTVTLTGGRTSLWSQDRNPTWSTNELDKKYQDGWFERLGQEVGTAGDATESWRTKMQSLGQWPDHVE